MFNRLQIIEVKKWDGALKSLIRYPSWFVIFFPKAITSRRLKMLEDLNSFEKPGNQKIVPGVIRETLTGKMP